MNEKPKLLCLNLGSGFEKRKSDENAEWINLDNDPSTEPEVVRDVLKGLPFDNDKFDIVFCSHVLEHFGGYDFIFVMNEIHRVLKPYGELALLSPYHKHFSAWTDPHHKIFFREESFVPWFFPSKSSFSMGIKGWFQPVVLENAEDSEFRAVMKKVPNTALVSYKDKVGVKVGEGAFTAPDFVEQLRGTKFYGKKN